MSQGPEAPPIASWMKSVSEGSYEETCEALEAAVAWLERGGLTLELSIQCYETGLLLSERCAAILEAAELRVSQIESSTHFGALNDLDDHER
ncbi:MAG: exodeoxyribonuclease VII small subunit [Chloroflexota bacterium]|nr:exodeoxyribonuclease VII small subunit [Chloroflexota bacterium]